MKRIVCFYHILLLTFCAIKVFASDTTMVKSPDGSIHFKLFKEGNQLRFSISYLGNIIIAPSPLVMSADGISLTNNNTITSVKRNSISETYPVSGVHAIAVNRYNEAKIFMKSGGSIIPIVIEIRVFNDGAAFRQIVNGGKPGFIPGEATVFNLPAKSTVWYHDLDMHYESVHVKKPIDQIQEGEWLAPPATFKIAQGFYASITEANLVNYSGMALQANGKNGLAIRLANDQPTSYPYRLRYSAEDTARLKLPVKINNPVITPWRVVIIGKNLNAMVNNDIVNNLNPSPDPKLFPQGIGTGWIKPGRAVWKYLNGGGDGTVDVMKHFTDGAAALGFEYNILEGFWSRWTDEQIKDLVSYSRQKNVGIWLWKHSKNLRNAASRDSFFRKCSELGIMGAKIDFFDHEAKEVIDLYEQILKEGAKYQLLFDFHGANKPTGLSRTYPNELTREAVKGMEASRITDRATHETTIPFTRLLVGPAEYTVLHFGERRKNTTWAHQIASAAILSAPLLTYAANPDTILANPAVNIIKNIPATWDETIVLSPSEIGELAVIAKRNGNKWFLAIMNGIEPRKIKIPLNFLKSNYKAVIAKDDAANPASVIVEEKNFSPKDVLEIDLVAGGGFIAQLSQ